MRRATGFGDGPSYVVFCEEHVLFLLVLHAHQAKMETT